MSFPYKNPISPSQLTGQQSLNRTKTYGTNYSILSTGGYMEVYSLNELYYTIPPSTFGPIEFSGNSIPITFSKGSGLTFSYDTLVLHPDNISSGRRKLGMMVYVYEENQHYQFIIDNYESLWTAATASTGCVVISEFGTTVKANTPEGIAFISGWTANTIDGVSGETYSTAVWKKYAPEPILIYTYVSGATYSALTTDDVIGVDSSISATTIYLPDSISSGTIRYEIKDIGLNSFNNNITIISAGSDIIISTENSNNVVLESDGGALIFFNTATGIWLQM